MKCVAAHSNDIRLDIYDVHRIPTVPASKPLSLSVYKSSTTIFAWPQLLPASQMDRVPVLYAELCCAGLLSRNDEHPEQSEVEFVRQPHLSCSSLPRCAQATASPVAAQYVMCILCALRFHYWQLHTGT